MNEQLENKFDLLAGSLESYINEQVSDQLRSKLDKICEIVANRLSNEDKLQELDERITYQTGYTQSTSLRVDRVQKMLDDLTDAVGEIRDSLVAPSSLLGRIDQLAAHINGVDEVVTETNKRIDTDVSIQCNFNQTIINRLNKLETTVQYHLPNFGRPDPGYPGVDMVLRVDALEKRVNKTHDEVCPASNRIRGLAQEEFRRHLDSEAFRERVFGIVELELDSDRVHVLVDDMIKNNLQNTKFVGTVIKHDVQDEFDSEEFRDRLNEIVHDVVGRQLQDTKFVGTLSAPPTI